MTFDVVRVGATTPLGLAAAPTCAAFRAGIKATGDVYHPPFPSEPVIGGRVPANPRLRRSMMEWLANLSVRAIAEAIEDLPDPGSAALVLNLPEFSRSHPDLPPGYSDAMLSNIQSQLGVRFGTTFAYAGGHAGALAAVFRAGESFRSKALSWCCIAGVDSLVNDSDVRRLKNQSRLKGQDMAMGVMPSEGAGAFVIAPQDRFGAPLARILGAGVAQDGPERPRARGLGSAFEQALENARVHESQVAFTVTDFNSERPRAIDYAIAEMRTFRTIRPAIPHWTLAASAGDTGAASGALTIVVASTALAKRYAPGPVAVCAASSDDGGHAACVVQAPA